MRATFFRETGGDLSGNYEKYCLLGRVTANCGRNSLPFRRRVLTPSTISLGKKIETFLEISGFDISRGKRDYSSSKLPDRFWRWLTLLLWVAKILSLGLEQMEGEGDHLL